MADARPYLAPVDGGHSNSPNKQREATGNTVLLIIVFCTALIGGYVLTEPEVSQNVQSLSAPNPTIELVSLASDYSTLRQSHDSQSHDSAVPLPPQNLDQAENQNSNRPQTQRTLLSAQEKHPMDAKISTPELTAKVYGLIRAHAPATTDARMLAREIVAESARQGYDPLFVSAVIKSESTFNTLARSDVGAQGLMQVMPKTDRWLAEIKDLPRGKLTDPGYNLRVGITYLKHLEELYRGDKIFTLIGYNWGPGRVESASDGKRRVPPEVMTYAIKILNDYRRWKIEQ